MLRAMILALLFSCQLWPTDLVLKDAPTQVYFSPHGGCEDAIVDAITSTKGSVFVLAYTFTSAPIARALKDAHDRGIDVRVILDRSQRTERYSVLDYLQHSHVPVWIDSAHGIGIAHNKVMVIDRETVITGSFNFTKMANDVNGENVLIIKSKDLARLYAQDWARHREHSERSEE